MNNPELHEAYKELLVKFDELREWLTLNEYGLCHCLSNRRVCEESGRILSKDFRKQGIPLLSFKWLFTKSGYDARRRWIEKRIQETSEELP